MQPDDALEYHPLATIFPPLDPAEFEALKEDIREHGLREPITVFENKILDGIHRYKACLAVGVAPRFRDYEGNEPLAFVLGLNLRRRHLTPSQRAVVAARVMPEFEAEARANMIRGGQGLADLPPAHSRDRAAAVVGVSSRLVGSAARVLDRGVPELVAAVERDQVKVSAAAAIAGLREEQQANLVARGPRAIRARASELRRAEKARPADGLSAPDREWLKGLPLWDQLTDQSIFIREAMVWKRVQPLLDQVRLAFPGLDAESREMIIDPHKTQLVVHLLNLRPPEEWKVCFQCTGTGSSDDPRDPRCSWCRGDGFEITKRGWREPPSTTVG
jgi:ParB-like chromosome segregation protein Spo0J